MRDYAIITQHQETAIKKALENYSSDELLQAHLEDYRLGLKGFAAETAPLNDMSPVQLAKALYGGYEIEEELKTFVIPVQWAMEQEITLKAKTLEEAIEIVLDADDLPDGDYVENSFEIRTALMEELDEYGEQNDA